MKTLYMHLGTPKTATSSIQVACANNNELLHQFGYSFPLFPYTYPGIRTQRNGHFLIEASLMRDKIPDQETTWQDRLALGLKMVHDEFETCDNVILTDESFWCSLNYNKQSPLAILQKDAEEHGYCIKTVVYLRRQDSFLISRWNQFVKEGTMTASLPDHLKKMLTKEPLVSDYAAALDKMAAQIGKENIIVRRFEPASWVGGSIYTDFAAAIGLPSEAALKPPKNDVNLGLKGNAVDIQLTINRISSLSLEDKVSFAKYTKKLSANMAEEDQYNPLSPEETAEFLAQFEEGNERVARGYIGDGKPLFSSKVKDAPKWERDNCFYRNDTETFLQILPPEKQTALIAAAILDLEAKNEELAAIREKNNALAKKAAELSHKLTALKHPLKTAGKKLLGK
ncbi:MAG: hypothetical protein LUF35_03465 [Lachnospiraceae bacterium]|nr:hypothetical protein [Lachnospiraceae bacterium]